MHFLHTGRERETLSGTEEHRTTMDCILAFFCQGDEHLDGISKPPHATVWPSEVVTLGVRHALTGVGNRAFYRWLTRDSRALFPRVPERTRLLRLFMESAKTWGELRHHGLFRPHDDWQTAAVSGHRG